MKKIITLILISIFSCKGQEKDKINTSKSENSIKKTNFNDTVKEIYIGKLFFAGDELNYYLSRESKDFKEVDSLSYSIYQRKNTNNYILSLERFLKDDDVAKYEIIDTIHFKNYDSNNSAIKENINESNINIVFYIKNKEIKSWNFNKKKKPNLLIPDSWVGIYQMKINENSKDWRESTTIRISISKDSIIYQEGGYQSDTKYNLKTDNVSKDKIYLKFLNHIGGLESEVLKETKDFGEISYDGVNYKWVSPYIDISFMGEKKNTYILKKK